MSSLIGKLREYIFPSDDEFEMIENYPSDSEEGYPEVYGSVPEQPLESKEAYRPMDSSDKAIGMSNVVGMPVASRFWGSVAEVLVMEPRAFEEMPQVIQSLRERKSVVLNLSMMEPAQAQRAVDFVAGATFTIDGHQERVGENIFLFTPSCVQVRTQAGVIKEAPQSPPSRVSTTSWQTDPVLSHIAQ